ncbi:MAG: HAMP domain-containing histidine kinase [Paramuribaculum sp.]|nr:HAMP domain-containing histidine kinase [Paramuribaculum sp.]
MDIYSVRKKSIIAFVVVAIAVVAFFMFYSSRLVKKLTEQERERMELWAEATRRLIESDSEGGDVDFMLSVIEANHNIPVVLTDDKGQLLQYRNISEDEIDERFAEILAGDRSIPIEISENEMQYLYYQDSDLLRRLAVFPYVQTGVMIVFVLTVYFAVAATKRAEQNKVWVGLSKETAHQLGTPISSLIAWLDILHEGNAEEKALAAEMEADVSRLSVVASRFSKIGSPPDLSAEPLADTVGATVAYMKRRVSSSVEWNVTDTSAGVKVEISRPLTEWVIECIIKNAVDAMNGKGSLTVDVGTDGKDAYVEITDTGQGIPSNRVKRVFKPGYTTKERGWGLGLTLAKRIIEDYQHGRIFVKRSQPGVGTTIRIELPTV